MRALVALAAGLPVALAVHHFKELNTIQDLELLGMLNKNGRSTHNGRHTSCASYI